MSRHTLRKLYPSLLPTAPLAICPTLPAVRYKIVNGYYLVAGKMVAFGLCNAAKKRPCIIAAAIASITATIVASKRR